MIMKLLISPIFTLLCILATSSQAPFFGEPKQNYNETTIKPSKIQRMKKIAYKSAGPKFDYKGHVDPKDIEKLAAYVGDFGVLGSHKLFRNKRSEEDWSQIYNDYLTMMLEAFSEEMIPKIPGQIKTLGKNDNDILGQHEAHLTELKTLIANTDQTGEGAPPTGAINPPPKPDDEDSDADSGYIGDGDDGNDGDDDN